MRMRVTGPILFGLLTALCACGGSTRFVSTYTAPEAKPINWKGQKVAAFLFTPSEATRRSGELELSRELTRRGARGVPGYELVPAELSREGEKDRAKELLREAGAVGAVVMRLVGRDQKMDASPGALLLTGSYYPSFWGYWDYGWSAVYQPGYINTETVLTIETLIYSIEDDTLLWAGRSSTTSPGNLPRFIRELSAAAGRQIRKQGLVRD